MRTAPILLPSTIAFLRRQWTNIITKGSLLVKLINKTIKHLLGIKNRQIRTERERSRAFEEANKILSAYIALLTEKYGEIKVSRAEIGRIIGHIHTSVSRSGDDYVITVDQGDNETELHGSTVSEDGDK